MMKRHSVSNWWIMFLPRRIKSLFKQKPYDAGPTQGYLEKSLCLRAALSYTYASDSKEVQERRS